MIKNIHNNPQVLKHIEWDSIVKILDQQSHFASTIPQILSELSPNMAQMKIQRTQTFQILFEQDDFYDLIARIKQIDSESIYHRVLFAIKKQQALKLVEINQLVLILEIYLDFYFDLNKLQLLDLDKEQFHLFKQKINKNFLKEFRRFVKPDGSVEFENHPQLKPLYLKQIEIEQNARIQLTNLINHETYSNRLQFQSYDLINDHYVIPIKSDSYSAQLGQIISRSETGHTLFIEPYQISKLNQKRLELVVAIQEVIAKIELDLIRKLQTFELELTTIVRTIEDLDELHTRYSFARELNCTAPQISHNRQIDIRGFFHPLIKNPVKNDFFLPEDKSGFIISGPNTGGKTATLKSLALIQIFLKFGLFIPCSHAEVYAYENIFYFGNDQQQLEEGLSSFSAEVTNYIQLFNQLGDSNLILIDEIFNSTSSEEASALAMAIFKHLKDNHNCHVVVSSHHQTLKTIMHQNEDYISAHVGFDLAENKPTYKIHIGSPGSSYALNIFKAMTNDNFHFENLYEIATRFLDNKAIHYEKLLESLSQKENTLNKVLQENKELNLQLKNQKDSMQGIIRLKTEEQITKTTTELDLILKKAKQLLQDVKDNKIVKTNKLQQKFADLKSEVKRNSPFSDSEFNPSEKPNLSDPVEFKEGEYYYCLLVNKTVLLKKLYPKKDEAFVSVGNINLKCPLNKLKTANNKPLPHRQHISIHIEQNTESKLEYDCRGMRLAEFEDLIQKEISNLLVGNIPYLNIIHGHGDGILKNWLRKFIKNNKDIAIYESEDGNDGSTRIILN